LSDINHYIIIIKDSDNKTANIDVINCRFKNSITMTPIKRRKPQKFVYCIFAYKNFSSSLHYVTSDDIVMMT